MLAQHAPLVVFHDRCQLLQVSDEEHLYSSERLVVSSESL